GSPISFLWLGVQAGYDHYALAGHAYLQEPWVQPYGSLLEGGIGTTQLLYRHGENDYLGSPFGRTRDGPLDTLGLSQVFFLGAPSRTLRVGWEYEEERPRRHAGADFRRRSNLAEIGVGLPAWWDTMVELFYVYRHDDYLDPNSFTAF